LQKGSSITVR